MSTYYDYTLFYKNKQTNEIKAVAPGLSGSFNKTLLSGWGLDSLIEESDVSEDWENAKNKILEFESIYFKGYYSEEELAKTGLSIMVPTESQERNFPADAKLKGVVFEDAFKEVGPKPVEQNSGVAICLSKTKTYKRGWWLDVSSLDKYIERHYKLLKEDILKKDRWEHMSQSLDYLKLSEKEKDRVRESMDADYLLDDSDIWDPDENYNFYVLRVALELKGLISAFVDFNTEVKLFVYNLDDSEGVE